MSDEQNIFGSSYRAKKAKREATPPHEEINDAKSVSYRIGSALQQRIKEKAESVHVGQADLVRFLLMQGLEALESGKLKLSTEEPKPTRLKIKQPDL